MKLYFQFFEFKQLPPKMDKVAMGIWDFKAPVVFLKNKGVSGEESETHH